MTLIAITRGVSASLGDCELSFLPRTPIDVAAAREEHRAYEDALAALGARVISLPPLDAHPDAVFVEDTAVVLDEVAVITRMGAASRVGEVETVASALAPYRPVARLTPPATLEGGDVLQIDRTLFVGRTRRTNADGIEQLRRLAEPLGYRVVPVAVSGCLHLKSACGSVGDGTVLVNPAWIDASSFRGHDVQRVPESEPWAANVLAVGDTTLVSSAHPRTIERLTGVGRSVRPLDVEELRKAESGVTCMSLLLVAQ